MAHVDVVIESISWSDQVSIPVLNCGAFYLEGNIDAANLGYIDRTCLSISRFLACSHRIRFLEARVEPQANGDPVVFTSNTLCFGPFTSRRIFEVGQGPASWLD